MALFNFTIIDNRETNRLLHSIIQKLNQMGQNLKDIKDALDAANEKVDKVAADVTKLHDLINNAGETPTAEEWQAVKDQVSSLNTKLEGIDDQTAE